MATRIPHKHPQQMIVLLHIGENRLQHTTKENESVEDKRLGTIVRSLDSVIHRVVSFSNLRKRWLYFLYDFETL